jgi:hypothetical protein
MERALKAYRNYKNANAEFLRASANFKSRWPITLYRTSGHLNRAYRNSHQQMINAYARRDRTYYNFISAARKFKVTGNTVNKIKNSLIQAKYAPPNRPGGFGGIGYEMTALRWRKKPSRAKSASPARRHSA